MLKNLFQFLETKRLQQHFRQVDFVLRHTSVDHLTKEQFNKRDKHLTRLKDYAQQGIFPANRGSDFYSPCFIDESEQQCAVAHLLIQSGNQRIANQVVDVANYDFIRDMNLSELDRWAHENGFSRDELALIQPGYWYAFDGGFLFTSILAWVVGGVIFAQNTIQIKSKEPQRILAIIGIVVSVFTLLMGLICLWGSLTAYSISVSYGSSEYIPDGYKFDYFSLLLGGIMHLVVASFVGYSSSDLLLLERPNKKRGQKSSVDSDLENNT